MKRKTLILSLLAVAGFAISLVIYNVVFNSERHQKESFSEYILPVEMPVDASCQGWKCIVKSLEYADRLPEGVTRGDCNPDGMESWYESDTAIVNADGSLNEGYFVVNLDIELENKGVFYGNDKVFPVNGVTLYAFDDKKSTYIPPYYVSESCYDPVNDADNPRIGYSCVDFSEGKVCLILSYIVSEEIYSEYPEWNLLLNIIGIDIKSYSEEKAYNKYVEENGYPPFVMIALEKKE